MFTTKRIRDIANTMAHGVVRTAIIIVTLNLSADIIDQLTATVPVLDNVAPPPDAHIEALKASAMSGVFASPDTVLDLITRLEAAEAKAQLPIEAGCPVCLTIFDTRMPS